LRHWISDDKNVETRSHLTIFWQMFLFVFLIKITYSIIVRTKQMKCENKWEQLSDLDPIIARTSLYAIPNCIGTNSYYTPNKILLYLEQLIIIVNKFTPHLKQTNICMYSTNYMNCQNKCTYVSNKFYKLQNKIVVGTKEIIWTTRTKNVYVSNKL
jgi:hypothetical protein